MLSDCFVSTIIGKMLWEKLSSQANLDKKEKLLISTFADFWAPVPKTYLCYADWILGFVPMLSSNSVNIYLFFKSQIVSQLLRQLIMTHQTNYLHMEN